MSNISTALEMQDGIKEVIFSPELMITAARIAQLSDRNPEVMDLLLKYTAELSAGVATKIVSIVMPKSEFTAMMNEIKELEAMGENL